jgi:hypothetical protein
VVGEEFVEDTQDADVATDFIVSPDFVSAPQVNEML